MLRHSFFGCHCTDLPVHTPEVPLRTPGALVASALAAGPQLKSKFPILYHGKGQWRGGDPAAEPARRASSSVASHYQTEAFAATTFIAADPVRPVLALEHGGDLLLGIRIYGLGVDISAKRNQTTDCGIKEASERR